MKFTPDFDNQFEDVFDDERQLFDHAEELLHADLGCTAPAPDLTRSIMGRLGYMRVSPAVARRRRIRRWLNRSALAMLVLAVGGVGLAVFNHSPDARRPAGATIPSAIRGDLHNQQLQINSVIQFFRELPPAPLHLEVDGHHDGGEFAVPHILDDEVDQSAVAPVRWV